MENRPWYVFRGRCIGIPTHPSHGLLFNVMRELEKEFIGIGEVKGHKFTQIYASKWGFIYEVDTGGRKYYEVFKRRLNHQYNIVSYPGSKSFGKWAWTIGSLEKAKQKLLSFEKQE